MVSRLRVAGLTIAVGLLCFTGTAAAGGTNCNWGSSVGACGGLKFVEPTSKIANGIKLAQSDWKIFGSSATPGGVSQKTGLPKLPSVLPPIAKSVAGKLSRTSSSKGWLNRGGPNWKLGRDPKGRPGMVGAVPEPETWLMMVGGIGALGWFARRRARQLRLA